MWRSSRTAKWSDTAAGAPATDPTGRRSQGHDHARGYVGSPRLRRIAMSSARVEERHSITSKVWWMPARGQQRTSRVIEFSVGSMAARQSMCRAHACTTALEPR